MKKFKEIIKKENGSITMTVLASMLFITTVLVVSYFSISNQSSNQKKNVGQISKQYSVTDAELEERYNQKLSELNNMTYMKIDDIKALGNIMLGKTTNTETIDADGNKIIIPGGFKIVEEENVVTDKVENGFVIEDKNENQWVWIPVSSTDLAKMYVEDLTGWTMLGTSINTKYKSISTTLGSMDIARTNPGQTGNPYRREPDILSDESYDGDDDNRSIAGFLGTDGTTVSSIETMTTKLKEDYKNMIDSIKINNGFYIGRYELGINETTPQVKQGTVMNNKNWYELYKNCKYFSDNNVESRMIWGCQWDQVCRFINEHGEKVGLDDSKSYGNYQNSQNGASTGSGTLRITGYSQYWKVNNIYDIAGNCYEWTQEAHWTDRRIIRGRSIFI